MDEAKRKLLTEEVLGECWHYYRIVDSGTEKSSCSCGMTGYSVREICTKATRTFTTGNDMIALKDRIVEMGEWAAFVDYAFDKSRFGSIVDYDSSLASFTNWFLDPTRFCELVASWWAERKVKG